PSGRASRSGPSTAAWPRCSDSFRKCQGVKVSNRPTEGASFFEARSVDAYIRPAEAAERLAVSVKMIYKLIATGLLKALRVGRSVRVLLASLNDFIALNTISGPTPPTPRPRRAPSGGFLFLPPRP